MIGRIPLKRFGYKTRVIINQVRLITAHILYFESCQFFRYIAQVVQILCRKGYRNGAKLPVVAVGVDLLRTFCTKSGRSPLSGRFWLELSRKSFSCFAFGKTSRFFLAEMSRKCFSSFAPGKISSYSILGLPKWMRSQQKRQSKRYQSDNLHTRPQKTYKQSSIEFEFNLKLFKCLLWSSM